MFTTELDFFLYGDKPALTQYQPKTGEEARELSKFPYIRRGSRKIWYKDTEDLKEFLRYGDLGKFLGYPPTAVQDYKDETCNLKIVFNGTSFVCNIENLDTITAELNEMYPNKGEVKMYEYTSIRDVREREILQIRLIESQMKYDDFMIINSNADPKDKCESFLYRSQSSTDTLSVFSKSHEKIAELSRLDFETYESPFIPEDWISGYTAKDACLARKDGKYFFTGRTTTERLELEIISTFNTNKEMANLVERFKT